MYKVIDLLLKDDGQEGKIKVLEVWEAKQACGQKSLLLYLNALQTFLMFFLHEEVDYLC